MRSFFVAPRRTAWTAARFTAKYVGYQLLKGVALASRRNRKGVGDKALVIPPAPESPGSLGDEAMIQSATQELRSNFAEIDVLDPRYIKGNPESSLAAFDVRALIEMSWWTVRSFLAEASTYRAVYFIGADTLDGHYSSRTSISRLRLLGLISRTGTSTFLVNVSFGRWAPRSVIRALKGLPRSIQVVARGPECRAILEHHLGRTVSLSADIAFALEPAESSSLDPEVWTWLLREREMGRPIVGVNAIIPVGPLAPDKKKVVQCYVTMLEALAEDFNASFLFIPHDLRPKHLEVQLNQSIIDSVSSPIQKSCYSLSPPYSAAEVKYLCGNLDTVVTGRMHLAVASLSQAVPTICVGENDKFIGFLQHFGCEDEAFVDLRDPSTDVAEAVCAAFIRRDELRQEIRSRLPEMRRLVSKALPLPSETNR
jgi:polysaccharide pyruvyl transferase WcaK-like protein